MSHTIAVGSSTFDSSPETRLTECLLNARIIPKRIEPLTPDASMRRYFRITTENLTIVAAIYPEPLHPNNHAFFDISKLFGEAQLPVPEIISVDAPRGIVLQQDLGKRQLFELLEHSSEEEREHYIDSAITLIVRIQHLSDRAYERDSISSRLAFDTPKLLSELDFFLRNYFELRDEQLPPDSEEELRKEFYVLSEELAKRDRVLCHRDFHAANLIVNSEGRLGIIDYQDARMGPASYDLVSLLLDRQLTLPSLAELRQRRLFFLEQRRRIGLDPIDPDEFAREFRLAAIHRGLKAIGTFSFQARALNRKDCYLKFIEPTLKIVLQSAEWLNRFPALCSALYSRIDDGKVR